MFAALALGMQELLLLGICGALPLLAVTAALVLLAARRTPRDAPPRRDDE